MWCTSDRFGPFLHVLRQTCRHAPAGVCGQSPKRLRRIVSQKKIAGICAGFAEYFDTDVTLMRIIWVALLLLPPQIGLFAYIICWFVLPKE